MFYELNAAETRATKHQTQHHANASRENCLLCRVLWPTLLPHRHLSVGHSSEAETLLVSTKQKP
jgi:hypothetical protein